MSATALCSITVGDDAASWERAGFRVEDGTERERVRLGGVEIILVAGDERGVRSLGYRPESSIGFDDDATDPSVQLPASLDGIPLVAETAPAAATTAAAASTEREPATDTATNPDAAAASNSAIDGVEQRVHAHPNGVTHIDHVVISSNRPAHTQAALESLGCIYRRTRTVGEGATAMEQRFLWWGPTLIELIGPAVPDGADAPAATVWGLSLACQDLAVSAAHLGELLGPVKRAVQSGRSIATLRTGELDISTRIAVMSPHLP